MNAPCIVVIIAAYNARDTIARAVHSALRQREVAEVIVIDDASTDDTAEVARNAGKSDSRLNILVQQRNMGPSAARNWAIRESKSPLIAILDADDYLLPDRFKPLLSDHDWDLCADNLVFFSDPAEMTKFDDRTQQHSADSFNLDFEHFVAGNISQRKRIRGELGFLKPVIQRAFLENHRLSYDEGCRLGEDFILYTMALAQGARFKVVVGCGYAAEMRSTSLSGNHGVSELKALHARCVDLLKSLPLTKPQFSILRTHLLSIRRKIVHRQVLEIRHDRGIFHGILAAARNPTTITDILLDRLYPADSPRQTPRKLLTFEDLAKYKA